MKFIDKLNSCMEKNNSLISIGLDPVLDKIPTEYKDSDKPLFAFNKSIIDATHDLVCAYKPNSAFYEAIGANGIEQLKQTCDYINQNYSHIPVIIDAKRGDIGSTNNGYIDFVFNYLQADAITLSPYMGQESLQPFLDLQDKGCVILCKNSNPGANEFQALEVGGEELYKTIARAVSEKWNKNGNCLLVAGATYPEDLLEIRKIVGDEITLLVPGIGAQGGDLEAVLQNGLNTVGEGLIINSARAIIYAGNPRQAAQQLQNDINSRR